MTVELSTITFTEQDDIVPVSGVEQIFNTGIANTFSGNDAITGTGDSISTVLPVDGYPEGWPGLIPGIYNDIGGTIDTGDGDDIITGISYGREGIIPDYGDYGNGIINGGTIDTGNGNDLITGIGQGSKGVVGITALPGVMRYNKNRLKKYTNESIFSRFAKKNSSSPYRAEAVDQKNSRNICLQ